MRPSYEELLEENRLLKEENRALKRRLSRLEAEPARLKQEYERLKRRLGGKGDPPPFVKPARPGPGRRPGRKPGHPPANRPLPAQVDQEETLTLNRCPHCGTGLGRPVSERVRYVEDIIPPRAHVTGTGSSATSVPGATSWWRQSPSMSSPGTGWGSG